MPSIENPQSDPLWGSGAGTPTRLFQALHVHQHLPLSCTTVVHHHWTAHTFASPLSAVWPRPRAVWCFNFPVTDTIIVPSLIRCYKAGATKRWGRWTQSQPPLVPGAPTFAASLGLPPYLSHSGKEFRNSRLSPQRIHLPADQLLAGPAPFGVSIFQWWTQSIVPSLIRCYRTPTSISGVTVVGRGRPSEPTSLAIPPGSQVRQRR